MAGLLSRITTGKDICILPAEVMHAVLPPPEGDTSLEWRSMSADLMAVPAKADSLQTVNPNDPGLALVKDPWLAADTKRRMEAGEKKEAAFLWDRLQQEQGLTRQQATAAVRSRAAEFPHLRGHSGQCPLNESNLAGWRRALGLTSSGKVDWQAVHKLLARYDKCGRKNLRDQYAPFLEIFTRAYEHDKQPTWEQAYWQACIQARRAGMHQECIASKYQVRRWYKTHAHEGSVRLSRARSRDEVTAMRPHIIRSYDSIEAGEVFVADSHDMDMEVAWFDEDKRAWVVERPKLVAVQDVKSTKIVGWVLAVGSVNRHHIAYGLGQAIVANGGIPPSIFYIDNGADYNAMGFGSPVNWEGHEHYCLGELGITPKNALPFNPPAKPIERTFKNFAEWFCRLWSTYTGNRAGARPQSSRAAREVPETCPDFDEVVEAIGYFLRDHYHPKPKPSSRATGGESPDTIWNARKALRPALTRQQFMMSMCLPEKFGRVVQNGGVIQFGRGIYRHEVLFGMLGRTVYIRRPLNMLQRILICRADGAVICVADRQQTVPFICKNDADNAQLEAAIEENRRMMRTARILHQDRSGCLRSMPPVDALALLAPDADQERLAARVTRQIGAAYHHETTPAGAATSAPSASRQAQDAADPDTTARFAAFLAARGETATESLADETLTSRLQAFVNGQNEEHETP